MKEAIPVIATIIIRVGLTIPALTAASPKIRAPTIPIEEPIRDGTLRLASRISSKEISISKISKVTGKGTFARAAKIENNNGVGRISWWKLLIAIYIPGRSNVINVANIRTLRKKFANKGLKFVSSGEKRKSSIVAGKIIA